jgi:hypothetical protein
MLKITKQYSFGKIGVNEIEGLKDAMHGAMTPVLDLIKSKIYWNDDLELDDSEYKSRDGFIPYRSNCGGVELTLIIPKCEEYEFGFLEFGQCDPEYCTCHTGNNDQGCELDIDGHNDAKLRVWLKFEGIDDSGVMSFYLVLSGGNGDAPYFRESSSSTYFETEFTCKSIKSFKTKAKTAIAKLLKIMK